MEVYCTVTKPATHRRRGHKRRVRKRGPQRKAPAMSTRTHRKRNALEILTDLREQLERRGIRTGELIEGENSATLRVISRGARAKVKAVISSFKSKRPGIKLSIAN